LPFPHGLGLDQGRYPAHLQKSLQMPLQQSESVRHSPPFVTQQVPIWHEFGFMQQAWLQQSVL
jgi:hypothetical protein